MIIENVAVLFTMIAIGYIAAKSKYIPDPGKAKNVVSALIIKITLPLLIITALIKNNLDDDLITNALTVAAIAAIIVPLTFFIAWWVGKAFKIPNSTLVVHSCLSAFGNVIFLGYPLLEKLYGAEGLFYTAIYAMINDAYVYTMAIFLIAKHGTKHQGGVSLKRLINPLTISFVVAVLLMTLKVCFPAQFAQVLPENVLKPFSMLGQCTVPLAMIFIGLVLAGVNVSNVFKPATKYLTVVLKLIVMPVVLILVLRPFGLAPLVIAVVVMQMAMPSQTMVSVFAREYGADSQYSAEGTFLSILCSVITMPIILSILNILVPECNNIIIH